MTINPPAVGCYLLPNQSPGNKSMKSEMTDQSRLASFYSYPYTAGVSAFELSEAGFHYEGQNDEVICRQCGLQYSGWQKGDDHKGTHLKKSPNCPFFQSSESGVYGNKPEEVPMSGACGGQNDTSVERGIEDKMQQQLHTRTITTSTEDQDTNMIDATKEKPKPTNESEYSGSVQNPSSDTSGPNKSDSSIQGENMTQAPVQSGLSINNEKTQTEQQQTEHVLNTEDMSHSNETQRVESRDSRESLSDTSHDSISHTRTNESSTGSLETVPPRYQQFAVLATRLTSYRYWPKHLKQRPEVLAKAGLFYEGTNDNVRCFHCAGGLREWDPEDDPFYEHARWFPFCPFMRLMKGDKYITGVQSGTIKPPDVQWDDSRQDTSMFENPAVLSVMELGYKKAILTKAITVYRERHGTDLCAEKLLPIVWEIEENDDIAVAPEDDQQTDHNQEERECESTCEDTTFTEKGDITHTKGIDELTEENLELREQKRCKVCLDEEASIVFLPCGHLVTCPMCASALRRCPVCRTFIRGTVKAIIA